MYMNPHARLFLPFALSFISAFLRIHISSFSSWLVYDVLFVRIHTQQLCCTLAGQCIMHCLSNL